MKILNVLITTFKNTILAAVGFEPTPPKRLVPKTSALDHSAIQPIWICLTGRNRTIDLGISAVDQLQSPALPTELRWEVCALVAQLAALRSYEPMVQGSSPCRSIMFLHGFDPCTSQKYSDPGSNRAPTAC